MLLFVSQGWTANHVRRGTTIGQMGFGPSCQTRNRRSETNIKQNDGDINHVARTPELESESTNAPLEYDKKAQRKLKRAYKKDPSGLSITTGKYKRKKNRNKLP